MKQINTQLSITEARTNQEDRQWLLCDLYAQGALWEASWQDTPASYLHFQVKQNLGLNVFHSVEQSEFHSEKQSMSFCSLQLQRSDNPVMRKQNGEIKPV